MSGIGDIGVRVGADISEFVSGMNRVEQIAETSMRRTAQAQKIAQAAADKFTASLQFQVNTFGKGEADVLRYRANLLGVGAATEPLIAKLEQLRKTTADTSMVEASTRNTHAMEGFSFATAGAKRELLVLAHELSQGNYSKFGGSMLVLAERTGAASLLFNPLTLGILATAAATAALGYEVYKGHEDWAALSNSIKTTGDYTGYTQHQIDKMSVYFARSTAEIQTGREALIALISTGRFSGDQLQLVGRAALDMASDTGKSIDDVAKELAKLPDGARKWAEEYQKTHHVFTAANIELITSLDKQANQAAAVAAVLDALNEAHKRVADTMRKDKGTWDRFWDDWADGLSRIKNGLRGLGTPTSDFDKINDALRTRANLEASLATMNSRGDKESLAQVPAIRRQLDANLALIDSLRKLDDTKKNAAKSNAAAGKSGDGQIAVNKYLDGGTKSEAARHKDAIAAENKAYRETIANLDNNSKQYEAVVAHHKENLIEIEKQSQKQVRDTTGSALDGKLKLIQGAIDQEKQIYDARNRNIDFLYKNDLLSSAEYYAAKSTTEQEYVADTIKDYDKEVAAVKASFAKDEQARQLNLNKINEIEAKKRALLTGVQDRHNEDVMGEAVLAPQREYNRLMEQSSLIRKIEADYEKKIAIDEKMNLISNLEGMILISEARKKELNDLQAVSEKTGAIALANPMNKKMRKDAEELHAAVEQRAADADLMKEHFEAFGTNALTGFFESTLSGTKTVGQAFSGMTKSILSNMLQMESQAIASKIMGSSAGGSGVGLLSSIASFFVGGSGGGAYGPTPDGGNISSFTPPRASGGPVWAGQSFMVGEKGPEIFAPTAAGTIIPNGSFGGSAGITVHNNPVIHIDSRTDQADVHRLVSSLVQQGNANLIDQLSRAGRL